MAKILVVDDEESIRFSFQKFLSNAGHEVTVAENIIDARAILSDNEFDVAVIDRILKNGQNGLDLVKHIRKVQPFCEPILISAYPTFRSAAETLQYGTFAYLTKPVKQEEICRVVNEAANKSETKKNSGHYEKILQSFFDSSPNAIVICDLSCRIKFINPSFSRIFRYEKKEVIGRQITYMHGWNQKKTESDVADLLMEKPVPEKEIRTTTKNGQMIDVTISQSVCRNSKGEPTDILFIIRDVTAKRKIEKQFLHAQKMGAIGTLAGGLAHDFNNILLLMFGYVELAIMHTPEDNPAQKNLLEVMKAASRAKELTKKILNCSRMDEPEQIPIKIDLIIKEALKLLRAGIPNSIDIQQDIHANCGTILGDPGRIHQLMINLCTNAYHSMREKGGTLKVGLQNISVSSEAILSEEIFQNSLDPGDYIRLTVSDTGHGMDKNTMDHIFDPYFTTKAAEEGTGLGLSVVHGIVKSHGGSIMVQSKKGKGSTFHVCFPKIESLST
ncbi:MAG: PAS domain S-box protein, partial [Deltaproteobacteria bacterium]|nr:PAS domain S-box protein [Deltaproteobacteria bacterium]